MVAQIASFTNSTKSYEVTVEDGQAVSCTCPDHQYRHRTCKHMMNAQGQIEAEVKRAALFLALKHAVMLREREATETARAWREYHAMPW